MKLAFQLIIGLVFLFAAVPLAYAGPNAGHPEGAFRSDLNASGTNSANSLRRRVNNTTVPFGCEITGTRYVDSPKCEGGKCLVQDIDCCGNGHLDTAIYDAVTREQIYAAEACDGESFCRDNCTYCGDGLLQADLGEQCDAGSRNGQLGSNCSVECKLPDCGNGVIEDFNNEVCDDGNEINDDTCSNACQPPRCGDGILQDGEQCDLGNANGRPNSGCNAQCNTVVTGFCGDGIVNSAGEQCDLGRNNGRAESTFRFAGNEYFCTETCRRQAPVCEYNLLTWSDHNSRIFEGDLTKTSCLNEIYQICDAGKTTGPLAQSLVDDCVFYTLMNWATIQAEKEIASCYLRAKPRRDITESDYDRISRAGDLVGFRHLQSVFPKISTGGRVKAATKKNVTVDPEKWLRQWYSQERNHHNLKENLKFAQFNPIFFPLWKNPFADFYTDKVNRECMALARNYDVPEYREQGGIRAGAGFVVNPLYTGGTRIIDTTGYKVPVIVMDSQCRISDYTTLGQVKTNQICSRSTYRVNFTSSPISLLWNGDSNLNASVVVTDFQLDPRLTGKAYQWKGSSESPLLVFDPKGTGKVTSAYQLFGEWTFGDLEIGASMNEISMSASPKKYSQPLWKNGYEALRKLDQNSDGQVSGDERLGLALWFDHNQNAISETGEVVSLLEAGVTSISTSYDQFDELGDLYSYTGFTRIGKDGKEIVGATVDWFSPRYDSKIEAIEKISTRAVGSASAVKSAKADKGEVNQENKLAQSIFNGDWQYKVNFSEMGESVPDAFSRLGYDGGYLKLKVSEGGAVHGYTISEKPVVSDKHKDARSMVFTNGLRGKLLDSKTLSFIVTTPDGVELQNEVYLQSDNTLTAITTMKANLKQGLASDIKYSWQAERM